MTLGNVIVRLAKPGMAALELGSHDNHTHMQVTEVIDAKWFVAALIVEAVRLEPSAAATVRGSHLRELSEVIKADVDRGIPKREKEYVQGILPILLAKTIVKNPSAPFISSHSTIEIFYGGIDNKPFWRDSVTRVFVSTE